MTHVTSSVALIFAKFLIVLAKEQVSIDVYYEALCTDSKAFFNNQLYPVISKDFQDNVNLTLYPYGKTKFNIDNNQYIFKCLNEKVCVGNKIHACALRLVDSGADTSGFGYNKKSLGLVNCLMRTAKTDGVTGTYNVTGCAQDYEVKIADDILECSKGQKGEDFLSSYGFFTDQLKPSLQSIPLIVFNKQNTREVSDEAIKDFKLTLCKQFKHDIPETCSGIANVPRLVVLLVVLVHFFSRNQ